MRNDQTIPPDGRSEDVQPRWRHDFPIDVPQDEYVSRRDFTKFMVLISFAFVIGQCWIVFQNLMRNLKGKPPIRKIATLSAIPVGATFSFSYPTDQDNCILIRTADRRFVAFSQKCTHLSCPVIPKVAENKFRCPCHDGIFDMNTGEPLAGPPRRPLPSIHLEVRGDDIFATGIVNS